LYSIQNENVYEVPRGYFNGLAEEIIDKVRPAKVVPMKRRSYNIIKYAVAAMFTGIVALTVFKYAGNGTGTEAVAKVNIDEELAKIPDADLVNYLEANGTDVKSALVASSVDADQSQLPAQEDYLLDDKTLDNYLNSINANDLKN
jgi:hypothetical protein